MELIDELRVGREQALCITGCYFSIMLNKKVEQPRQTGGLYNIN
jgi:hypothetical protein